MNDNYLYEFFVERVRSKITCNKRISFLKLKRLFGMSFFYREM